MRKYTIIALAMLASPLAMTQASAGWVGHGDAETREEATQIAMDHCRRNSHAADKCHVVREQHNPRVNATDWRVTVSTSN